MRLSLDQLFNLAADLRAAGRFDEAAQAYRAILSAKPEHGAAIANLALVLLELGRSDEAVPLLRRGLTIPLPDPVIARILLFQIPYAANLGLVETREITEEIVASTVSGRAAETLPARAASDGTLRIGWLSADLRAHSIARTILPVCHALRGLGCASFFYSDTRTEDKFTEEFRALAAGWRDIRGLDDTQACQKIRHDGLDVLVLLAARCDDNRPFFGAQRAAPLQVSLHDNATSALANVDAFLADRFLVPRPATGQFSERVLRLPSFYVHEPLAGSPEPGPPPCDAAGFVTFGCFNNPPKINRDVLASWATLLQRIPAARLVLKYRNAYEPAAQRARILSGLGVDPSRVSYAPPAIGTTAHLESYRDIALDTFPYGGVTTTFEALWMGVPVITLAGDTVASRQTASMLRTLGLAELVAMDGDGYAAIAGRLARDPAAIGRHRHDLRSRLKSSPLCDPAGRARQIARLFRAVLQRRHAAG